MKLNLAIVFSQLAMACAFTYLFLHKNLDFRYVRPLVLDGQYWRLATAPFTHAHFAHLGLNFGALLLIICLFPQVFKGLVLGQISLAILGGSSVLLILWPGSSEWYLGYSGILHGLFAYATTQEFKKNYWARLGLVALIAKICLELVGIRSNQWGQPIAVDLHLYGLGCGLLLSRMRGRITFFA